MPCLGLFSLIVPTFLFSIFHTTLLLSFLSVSSSYFTLARGILCGMHTSCMGFQFPIVYAMLPLQRGLTYPNLCPAGTNWGVEAPQLGLDSFPQEHQRQKVIKEIISTEKQHYRDLALVKKVGSRYIAVLFDPGRIGQLFPCDWLLSLHLIHL